MCLSGQKFQEACPLVVSQAVVKSSKEACYSDAKFWCRDPGRHILQNRLNHSTVSEPSFCNMASGRTIDPKVMTIEKGGTIQRVSFSEVIKNSSALKAWNDHEDRFADHFKSMKKLCEDFEQLKEKEQGSSNYLDILVNLYRKFMEAKSNFEKIGRAHV